MMANRAGLPLLLLAAWFAASMPALGRALRQTDTIPAELDRLARSLDSENPNRRAAAERLLRERVGLGEIEALRAVLADPLPERSLASLAEHLRGLIDRKIAEVEDLIADFEAARRLAREQARELDEADEPTGEARQRLTETRGRREEIRRKIHAGRDFLLAQGVALGPPLWQRVEAGAVDSPLVMRFHRHLSDRLIEEMLRIHPTAPPPGTLPALEERSLAPLIASLHAGDPEGWDLLRSRLAEEAVALLSTFDQGGRRRARTLLLELGEWGADYVARWADVPDGSPEQPFRRRIAEWNRMRVPAGFEERTGLDLARYNSLPPAPRLEMIFRLEWVGGRHAVPILARLLEIEEDLSLRLECAAVLARLSDVRGVEFLRRLGLEGAVAMESVSRKVLLTEAIRRREAGDLEGALAGFQEILRHFPGNHRVHYELAFTALRLGRYELAVEHFRRALAYRGDDPYTHYNLACAYALSEREIEALEELEAAIDAGFRDLEHISNDPDLEGLRELPRFQELLDEIGGSG
ncbi:MAG: tetratricopeptide repeat protein [Planctomycetota bacterium]